MLRSFALMLAGLVTSACGEHPEQLLQGRWRESAWSYERLDLPSAASRLDDLLALTRQRDRRIVHHEAEAWEFRPDGTLVISKRDGGELRRRWRLKGRGHVLTIRADDASELEVYDVKELNARELVLHYDIGMELRGIARLSFHSLSGT